MYWFTSFRILTLIVKLTFWAEVSLPAEVAVTSRASSVVIVEAEAVGRADRLVTWYVIDPGSFPFPRSHWRTGRRNYGRRRGGGGACQYNRCGGCSGGGASERCCGCRSCWCGPRCCCCWSEADILGNRCTHPINNISISGCPDAGAELRPSAVFLTARKRLYLQEMYRWMPERLNNTFFVKKRCFEFVVFLWLLPFSILGFFNNIKDGSPPLWRRHNLSHRFQTRPHLYCQSLRCRRYSLHCLYLMNLFI